MYDSNFAKEVVSNNMTDPLEILNWYRNLYYREPVHTEKGIMADAINDLFTEYKIIKVKF